MLRESGVVDAGAYGLTVMIAGCLAALRGDAAPELEHQYAPAALHRPEHESSSFRYCTNFAVTGESLDAGHFTPLLEDLGDSVLVVGDDRTLRVHVHTDDPDAAVDLFEAAARSRASTWPTCTSRSPSGAPRLGGDGEPGITPACAVVAVASGPGVQRLYEELGVLVVDGGPTMNPSTYELLAGIHAANAHEVLVLPEQRQRDPRRREGGRPLRQARARRADDGASGGTRRAACLRPEPRQRRQRARRRGRRGPARSGRRRARGPRRRPGPLRPGRRRRLRGRRARRLG